MSLIDEYAMPATLKRIVRRLSARQGIIGVVIVDPDGLTLDTNMNHLQAEIMSGYVQVLLSKINDTVRTISKQQATVINTITIELDTRELILTPDPEGLFTIVILRNKV